MSIAWSRIVRHPATLLVVGFVFCVLLYALTGIVGSRPQLRGTVFQPLVVAGLAAGGVQLYGLFQGGIEGRGNLEYAGPGALREGAAGAALGLGLFTAAVLGVWALGDLTFLGLRHGPGQLWGVLAMAIASGIYEEMIFRGVAFRHLETMLGSWAALALTSAFFGLAHIANPGASWFAAFAIAVEAGILLGAAYLYTRRLWLASGLHAGWNFTQGWIFSIPVSGGHPAEGLVLTSRQGSTLITGGAFGLEASVVALAVATAGGLALLALAVRHGGTVPPMWARRAA
jgi:membrane protease YdiL (CAAX protease family)